MFLLGLNFVLQFVVLQLRIKVFSFFFRLERNDFLFFTEYKYFCTLQRAFCAVILSEEA